MGQEVIQSVRVGLVPVLLLDLELVGLPADALIRQDKDMEPGGLSASCLQLAQEVEGPSRRNVVGLDHSGEGQDIHVFHGHEESVDAVHRIHLARDARGDIFMGDVQEHVCRRPERRLLHDRLRRQPDPPRSRAERSRLQLGRGGFSRRTLWGATRRS